MYSFLRILGAFFVVHVLTIAPLHALTLENNYPSYAYVFHEFDVDESYRYDEDFLSFVEGNEKQLKVFYTQSLQRGKEILPTMQGLLVDDGVSDLFIYLSMVESGFYMDAVSPKKAVGLWQFMPQTARHYDLTVCNSYDERCDMQSATLAAIAYLNKLYKQFGKWYLAAMAYNCGEGCVERAIERAGTDELSILADDDLQYVPHETRAYIKKILLVAMIGENQTFGLSDGQHDGTNETPDDTLIQVEVQRGTTLKSIATLLKMQEKTLFGLNKEIKQGMVSKDQTITIPIEKVYAFYLRYEKPVVHKTDKSHMISHHISLGETLEGIAKQYEADKEEIKASNHLRDDFLTVGDLLVIPVTQATFERVSE